MMKRCECGWEKKTSICRRRDLLQGYHEYEHWLHHAIITKLLAVPWRMRGLGPSGLDPRQPLASPTHYAQTLRIWELCSKGPSDNYTRQHDTRSRRLSRERAERGEKVSSILPAKWFEVMFDNELWVCEMCRGWICRYRFATFEYCVLWSHPNAEQFIEAKM